MFFRCKRELYRKEGFLAQKFKSKKLVTKKECQSLSNSKREIDMRVKSQIYKGIEYIRISSLPVDQKDRLYKSLNRKLIINILKDELLLNDCVQYQHYVTWYENIYETAADRKPIDVSTEAPALALAFK